MHTNKYNDSNLSKNQNNNNKLITGYHVLESNSDTKTNDISTENMLK